MDRLPQELFDLIVLHLDSILHHASNHLKNESLTPASQTLASFATVSQGFQFAVERLTFCELTLKSTDLALFEAAMSHEHRSRALEVLAYRIVLPSYTPHACRGYETAVFRRKNAEACSEAMSRLLALLSRWPADRKIHLYVHAYSPMDPGHRSQADEAAVDPERDIGEDRYLFSCLDLADMEENPMPAAPCVSRFNIGDHRGRQVTPDALGDLVEKLPGIDRLSLVLREPVYFQDYRRRWRQDWAAVLGLNGFAPAATTIAITVVAPTYTYKAPVPRLHPEMGTDPLLSAVRALGEGRTVLRYAGLLDASFFWPFAASEKPAPFWQAMEEMDLQLEMTTPTGGWYFKSQADDVFEPDDVHPGTPGRLARGLKPPGLSHRKDRNERAAKVLRMERKESLSARQNAGEMWQMWVDDGVGWNDYVVYHVNEDYDEDFPFEVDEGRMAPLLEGMARALAQMPRLRRFRIALDLAEFHPGNEVRSTLRSRPWAIDYRAPGEERGEMTYEAAWDDDELTQEPRFYLHVGDWEPSERLLALFRDVGRRNHGRDAVVVYPLRVSGFAGEDEWTGHVVECPLPNLGDGSFSAAEERWLSICNQFTSQRNDSVDRGHKSRAYDSGMW